MRLCCRKEKTKGAWTKQEDDKLLHYINIHGDPGCWTTLPKAAGLERCGKSCRMRWMKYLRPDIKRGNFCLQEEDLIVKLHALLGNRWSLIAGRLPGPTASEVKNYWNSHIKRKLINMGIDPNNHRINETLMHDLHMNNNIISAGKSPLDNMGVESSSINGDDEAVSLARDDHLNLDLTIAFHPPPPSSPRVNDDMKKEQVLQ